MTDLNGTPDAIFNLNTSGASPVLETYTNLLAKVGTYNLKLRARYVGPAYNVYGELSFTMNILDPCLSPTLTLTPPASTTISYYYTGNSPSASFSFDSISITPSVCPYTFACTSSESTDLCAMNSSPSLSNFDTTTGTLTFETFDVPGVVPGDYTVTITGTAGSSGSEVVPQNVIFKLINPCLTAILFDNTSFIDQTYII